ncbi:hypothetical protein DPMN_050928 [Dreissena polymorpha]|uniref:Uncharacterized protein n=1 Tax=Dreissena polymorpha TaxID=45954 RepID=A0A9D4HPR9_DREPO|nr:hypothetical protein DPMN_050928 [Dreissena polymorpha]
MRFDILLFAIVLQNVCKAIAVIQHYIFIVVFFLMLAEGFMITYLVLSPFRKRRIVVPFIIAAYAVLRYTFLKITCWLFFECGLINRGKIAPFC